MSSRILRAVLLGIFLVLELSGCAKRKHAPVATSELAPVPTAPAPPSPAPLDTPSRPVVRAFTGLACYYADGFRGRQTASGKHYNPNRLTAAHRTLPLGTKVKVTNLGNHRSVIVEITDRGPTLMDRIIDLSKRAAEELDMIKEGIAKVRLEILLD